jgi:hypothetical protein
MCRRGTGSSKGDSLILTYQRNGRQEMLSRKRDSRKREWMIKSSKENRRCNLDFVFNLWSERDKFLLSYSYSVVPREKA